ncbi:hypothetical protein [Tessaracoccus sp. MC1627]|uniref:hypothetical protein n=1 Tax=Tessaracoccus sp. MC1627 TaxID=2760312 RepID=UPI001C71E89B|nr:hypothetical protein [Tessaracoccus sp. MC1627]
MAFDSAAPINRRTVAKGIAWSVPAVAIAGTAPAFAASRCVPEPVADPTKSCKKAGQEQSYKLYFAISGETCNLNDCSGTITQIKEKTGQGTVLWTGTAALDGNTPVIICNTNNMASSVLVNATITCGTTTTTYTDFEVDMPNFNSAGNTCTDNVFCGAA